MSADYIDIHTHGDRPHPFQILNWGIRQGKIPESVFFSAGLHPWWISRLEEDNKKNLDVIRHAAGNENCLAIGETGLDKIHPPKEEVSFQKQQEIFQWHLELAQEFQKPLIIHCVRALSELLRELKKARFPHTVILHDYNGNPQQTKEFLKLENVSFSFGDKLWKENSRGFQSLGAIPAERVFLETDEKSVSIEDVYQRMSEVLEIPMVSLQEQIKNNAQRVFPQLLNRGRSS